jgi:Fe-S oxidoreductase
VELAKKENPRAAMLEKPVACNAVLFADVFTNYSSPQRGLATLRVLRALGVDVVVSDAIPDGRAAFSQGLIATAAAQAQKAAALLETFISYGRDVIVVEPSVLAMFRLDYRHLLEGESAGERLKQLREHTFDPMEFVEKVLAKNQITAAQFFPATESPRGTRIFYHSHCQQKTIGAAAPTERLLRAAGFDVVTSQVECCGMAGSFGYKKDYYDLSMAVGRDLFAQVAAADSDGPCVLVASGISCQEQLQSGMKRAVIHPMELLVETLSARRRIFS